MMIIYSIPRCYVDFGLHLHFFPIFCLGWPCFVVVAMFWIEWVAWIQNVEIGGLSCCRLILPLGSLTTVCVHDWPFDLSFALILGCQWVFNLGFGICCILLRWKVIGLEWPRLWLRDISIPRQFCNIIGMTVGASFISP